MIEIEIKIVGMEREKDKEEIVYMIGKWKEKLGIVMVMDRMEEIMIVMERMIGMEEIRF